MPRRFLLRCLLIFALLALALPGTARAELARLVADSVSVLSGNVLLAQGHVEVFYRGQKLSAQAIRYDQASDSLTITGPIRLEDGSGNVFTAEAADLSADLTQGILTSARLVLDQRLQLTAGQIQRSQDGRLTAMRSVVASSCKICAGSPTPLWEIRAREVVHDVEARRIYFSGVTLRFGGVPVIYLPSLRVPDPTQNRATGFLVPKLRSTSALGTGLKLPYFVTLGKSRDLLLTPYLTFAGGRTLEWRYRQAFAAGDLSVNGAFSRDALRPGEDRGYLSYDGTFDLGRDYLLSFSGIAVSDTAYLSDYGISDTDRLQNQVSVTRLKRDLAFSARLVGLRSLREGETNATLPSGMADLTYERRFDLPLLGGVAALRLDGHADTRTSTEPLDLDGDTLAEGQDLARLSLSFDWRRNWVSRQGLVLGVLATGALDRYQIAQDASYGGSPMRASGAAGVELRWPLLRRAANGSFQTLEPMAQLVLSSQPDPAIPNGDSTLVEFDEGSLFALDHFPGQDAVEAGARLNLGAAWRWQDIRGWSLGVTAGRVWRQRDLGQFSQASGLSGLTSDWLLAMRFEGPQGLSLANRLLLDDAAQVRKAEIRFDLNSKVLDLAGGYEYLPADPDERRAETASEIVFQAGRQVARFVHADLSARYDLKAEQMSRAGLQLDFRNECLAVSFSVDRRFASSPSQRPDTDFGLSVELLGFGGSAAGPSRSCRR